jgi:hypothetical protein
MLSMTARGDESGKRVSGCCNDDGSSANSKVLETRSVPRSRTTTRVDFELIGTVIIGASISTESLIFWPRSSIAPRVFAFGR